MHFSRPLPSSSHVLAPHLSASKSYYSSFSATSTLSPSPPPSCSSFAVSSNGRLSDEHSWRTPLPLVAQVLLIALAPHGGLCCLAAVAPVARRKSCGQLLESPVGAWLGTGRTSAMVVVKLGKAKKQEYPWPDNPDPNVKGGVSSNLKRRFRWII
ncbi:hypothetical protein NL676_008958 [Syzygium grande]|nr:hypothetical protein NL676_008958 [Syzygium grande]